MEKPELQSVVSKLIHARQMMLGQFHASSCILATRIGRDILKEFDIAAQPMPVKTYIYNQQYVEQVAKHGRKHESDVELHAWLHDNGAWLIGPSDDALPRPGYFRGHVVLWLPDWRVMLDLSADQFDSPDVGIKVPVAAYEVPDQWELGDRDHELIDHIENTIVQYIADPRNKSFIFSDDWTAPGAGSDIVRATINLIRLTT